MADNLLLTCQHNIGLVHVFNQTNLYLRTKAFFFIHSKVVQGLFWFEVLCFHRYNVCQTFKTLQLKDYKTLLLITINSRRWN